MKPIFIHDKTELETFLLKHREVNFYHLGDLDDFFWPYTTWYAYKEGKEIKAVILLYTGTELPVLLAIENKNKSEMMALANACLPLLPSRFYAHLSPGLEEAFNAEYELIHHGRHDKMLLTEPTRPEKHTSAEAKLLSCSDLRSLQTLYDASYPGNWFDPRMLDTGQYFGMYNGEHELTTVAGVHVYSPQYRIGALGNITTHPDYRAKGLGTAVTAATCINLLKTVDVIGLNVKSDNEAAIHIYHKLGFEQVGTYDEYTLTLK